MRLERVARRSATRRSTSSYSSWASSADSSSSQVRGAATRRAGPAAQRVRRHGGLGAVVLAPVDEHLAVALGLLHLADHQVGVVGLERPRQLPGDLRWPARRSDRPSSGAYRWMPLLPLVTGTGSWPMSRRMLADQPRDLGALGQAHPRPGVEVEHQPVGVLRLPVARRTATAARGSRARPSWASQVSVARSLTSG